MFIINKPGAAQSQVRIGWVGVARQTPDYFPITVMNTVLGEGMSRIGQPAIFGQLLAGVLLGPSVFGALMPEVRQAV